MPTYIPYTFSDSKPSILSPSLKEVGGSPLFELKVMKLLLGITKITNTIDNRTISPRNNYATIPFSTNPVVLNRNILNNAISPYTTRELAKYLLPTIRYQNQPFYEDVTYELANFFYKRRTSEVSAFMHIYRILERISYIFPLIYASNSKSYVGTFNQLKNYFATPNSELGFFRVFLEDFLQGDPLYSSGQATFSFLHPDIAINEQHFKLFKTHFGGKIVAETPFTSLNIKYKDLLDCLIILRNRYFHFKSADTQNISSKEIIDADIFFGIVNDIFLNWIAYIFFKILIHNIDKSI